MPGTSQLVPVRGGHARQVEHAGVRVDADDPDAAGLRTGARVGGGVAQFAESGTRGTPASTRRHPRHARGLLQPPPADRLGEHQRRPVRVDQHEVAVEPLEQHGVAVEHGVHDADCTPMSTTANPIPAANSANRTRSWVEVLPGQGDDGLGC